jgi:hypothetical protein
LHFDNLCLYNMYTVQEIRICSKKKKKKREEFI